MSKSVTVMPTMNDLLVNKYTGPQVRSISQMLGYTSNITELLTNASRSIKELRHLKKENGSLFWEDATPSKPTPLGKEYYTFSFNGRVCVFHWEVSASIEFSRPKITMIDPRNFCVTSRYTTGPVSEIRFVNFNGRYNDVIHYLSMGDNLYIARNAVGLVLFYKINVFTFESTTLPTLDAEGNVHPEFKMFACNGKLHCIEGAKSVYAMDEREREWSHVMNVPENKSRDISNWNFVTWGDKVFWPISGDTYCLDLKTGGFRFRELKSAILQPGEDVTELFEDIFPYTPRDEKVSPVEPFECGKLACEEQTPRNCLPVNQRGNIVLQLVGKSPKLWVADLEALTMFPVEAHGYVPVNMSHCQCFTKIDNVVYCVNQDLDSRSLSMSALTLPQGFGKEPLMPNLYFRGVAQYSTQTKKRNFSQMLDPSFDEWCDVTFTFKDDPETVIRAHKAVLVQHQWFKMILRPDTSTYQVDSLDSTLFGPIIDYIYGRLELHRLLLSEMISLYKAADMMLITKLMHDIFYFIMRIAILKRDEGIGFCTDIMLLYKTILECPHTQPEDRLEIEDFIVHAIRHFNRLEDFHLIIKKYNIHTFDHLTRPRCSAVGEGYFF